MDPIGGLILLGFGAKMLGGGSKNNGKPKNNGYKKPKGGKKCSCKKY